MRAERDELQGTKEQLEKEILMMKQQEMDTMRKYRLLEVRYERILFLDFTLQYRYMFIDMISGYPT